ncbi:hypothetical protein FisN_15Lu103 [Fistulifera solaris]|uniref:Uncharacterized protein n=1 Tax=Fistulifera solaris TaxID=1519565 RepID=A0A1Z5KB50_FISSO|nr:hypothetical protein FisN_15Lu103 [Fistulifera solaris]|eukprot:GAX23372.1 hypothetical protein FisN_15Lu103 [Fistulifera solaris]
MRIGVLYGCILLPGNSFLIHHSSTAQPHRSASSFPASQSTKTAWNRQQLEDYAQRQGIVLTFTTLGPAYRCIARSQHNTTQVLGYVEGILRPSPLLHLDKMEVFRPMVQRARAENPAFTGGGVSLGVGLLMGYLCLLHGQENGCKKAEFLAIDDEEKQHKRLVRYYRHAGFQFIKYVGDDIWDVPDRLVWGGCGTLLGANIDELLQFWTRLMQKSDDQKL